MLADLAQHNFRIDTKPELLATGPNQLWSWDITKLLGPTKWTYYYLYNILDVFSRYSVGWMIAERESASLAEELIADPEKFLGGRHRMRYAPVEDPEARKQIVAALKAATK